MSYDLWGFLLWLMVVFPALCELWWFCPLILLDGSFLHLRWFPYTHVHQHSTEYSWWTHCWSPVFSSLLWYSALQKLFTWPPRAPCSIFSTKDCQALQEFYFPVLWPRNSLQAVNWGNPSLHHVSHFRNPISPIICFCLMYFDTLLLIIWV